MNVVRNYKKNSRFQHLTQNVFPNPVNYSIHYHYLRDWGEV